MGSLEVTLPVFAETWKAIEGPDEKEETERVYPLGVPGPRPMIHTANPEKVEERSLEFHKATVIAVVEKWQVEIGKKPEEDAVSSSVVSRDPAQMLKTVIVAMVEPETKKRRNVTMLQLRV